MNEAKRMQVPAGATWEGWQPGQFQVHLVHTGVAESMFLVFPDSTTMLIDCGDQAAITRGPHSVPVLPGPHRLAGEWVARYIHRVSPHGGDVDWMLLTHFHQDHAGTPLWQKFPSIPAPFPGAPEEPPPVGGCARSGIGLAAETLRFRRAVDRAVPGTEGPIPEPRPGEPQLVQDHVRKVWEALRKRDGLQLVPFRLGAVDQFVAERGPAPGFSVRNVCANGRLAMPGGEVLDLYSEPIARNAFAKGVNENAMSLGMLFTYGAFRLWLGGDFSDFFPDERGERLFVEDILADAVGPVDVAKVNHHGHHALGRKFCATLRPSAWVACVWDNLHLTDDSMEPMLDPETTGGEPPMVFPTVLPVRFDGERPWWRLVPEECRTGSHVVITVPPGGETYGIELLDAADEDMRVKARWSFTAKSTRV